MKPNPFLTLVGIAFVGIGCTSLQSQVSAGPTWSATTNGLRIGISSNAQTQPTSGAEFVVTIQNGGDSDVVINLGYMLSNAKVMFPSAVYLRIVDPAGKVRDLKFFDRQHPGVAGRVDDFLVPLRRGAMYTLPVSLDNYSSPATSEFELALAPGRYRTSVRFEGHGATALNSDTQGIGLMNVWKGNVESGFLDFEVRR